MKERKLEVWYKNRLAGLLAEADHHRVVFQYDESWLENGFAISPFSLPVENRIFIPSGMNFQGLWGIFADSLPDAWGRLLMDRMLKGRGLSPEQVSPLERIAIVGASGMGAISYRPAWEVDEDPRLEHFDELADRCHKVLTREFTGDIDELYRMGGSSGGARPKVMDREWIVKFPASGDMRNAGVMEKEYMDQAEACGITVPESKLIPSKVCDGYFAVRRFDTQGDERVHVLTAAAMLELDWRSASMDYTDLMKLTKILSRGNEGDLEQMYRRMCFNVFAHNRDDHAKNFSWIYDEKGDCWHPSPAYDLTWSTTYYGEHSTTVAGNGRDPGMKELVQVGKNAGMTEKRCRMIGEEIRERTQGLEEKYRGIAT